MSKIIPRTASPERAKDPAPRHTPEVIGPHKPESTKQDTWTDWPKSSWSLFTDDFVHEKIGVFKVNLKSKLGAVSFKETLTNNGALELHDQVKFWFNIKDDKSLFAKVNSKGDVKVHYDNGVNKIHEHDWNFYSTLKMSKTIQKPSVRFGAHLLSDKCDSDNRIRIDLDGATNFTWSSKTIVSHKKFTFGFLSVFDITKKLLTRNKFLLGYKIDDSTEMHLREQNKDFRKGTFDFADWRSYFDSYTLDLVRTIDSKTKIGVQASFKPNNPVFDYAEVVAQRKFPEQHFTGKLKMRFGADLDISVGSKHNLSSWWNDILTVSLGAHGANLFSKKRLFSYGAQFEFNV